MNTGVVTPEYSQNSKGSRWIPLLQRFVLALVVVSVSVGLTLGLTRSKQTQQNEETQSADDSQLRMRADGLDGAVRLFWGSAASV